MPGPRGCTCSASLPTWYRREEPRPGPSSTGSSEAWSPSERTAARRPGRATAVRPTRKNVQRPEQPGGRDPTRDSAPRIPAHGENADDIEQSLHLARRVVGVPARTADQAVIDVPSRISSSPSFNAHERRAWDRSDAVALLSTSGRCPMTSIRRSMKVLRSLRAGPFAIL